MSEGIDFIEPVGALIFNEEDVANFILRSMRAGEVWPHELIAEIEGHREYGKVWEIFSKGKKEGIFWARVDYEVSGGPILKVGGVYINPKNTDKKIIREVDKVLDNYGREKEAKRIVFTTRRNARSFERYLGNGWEVDSVVMTRMVE